MRISSIPISFGILAILISGCVETLDLSGEEDSFTEGITINAIATPDTTLSFFITRALPIKSGSTSIVEMYSPEQTDKIETELGGSYREYVLYRGTEIVLNVNGDPIKTEFDPTRCRHVSDYRPKPDDKISVSVSQGSWFPTASSETIVPSAQKIEVLGVEKIYDSYNSTIVGNSTVKDLFASDTIARVTLRITEDSNPTGFYRLAMQAFDLNSSLAGYASFFSSDDLLFYAPDLTKAYGIWPAHFSNIFDNHLFENGTYTFSVDIRLRDGKNPAVTVELQTLDKDLYYYQQSVMLSRIADTDSYAESIQIHSNVKDGWGIFGAMATDRHKISINENANISF